jgi:TPR repeat protein
MNQSSKGLKAFHTGDYQSAYKHLLPLAQQGEAEAQCIIANIYQLGLGKEINLPLAIHWYEASANQGYGVASNNLFERYRLDQDLEKANYWSEKAIAQGFHHGRKPLEHHSKISDLRQDNGYSEPGLTHHFI